MTDEGDGPSSETVDGNGSEGETGYGPGAPVDFDRLELVRERLDGDDRFESVDWRPSYAPDRVVFTFDSRLYPPAVESASLEVVWYGNGDFSLHYREALDDGSFDHRWDRHPSEHNARDHVHPGPDAPTPGEDASHPDDWRDVLSAVLAAVDERRRAFWSEC